MAYRIQFDYLRNVAKNRNQNIAYKSELFDISIIGDSSQQLEEFDLFFQKALKTIEYRFLEVGGNLRILFATMDVYNRFIQKRIISELSVTINQISALTIYNFTEEMKYHFQIEIRQGVLVPITSLLLNKTPNNRLGLMYKLSFLSKYSCDLFSNKVTSK